MSEMSYDLIVIGGGPAGYSAALRARGEGAKVSLIEMGKLGGTCLNRGCIPTKCFYHSTKIYSRLSKRTLPEISFDNLRIDYAKMLERKNAVVLNLREGLKHLLEKMGVNILEGKGYINSRESATIIERDGRGFSVKGGMILIATGSQPGSLPFIPSDSRIHTTDSIWDLEKPPRNLLIIGGGVIGVEAATIYSAVSEKVAIVEILPEILSNINKPFRRIVVKALEDKGVGIFTGERIRSIRAGDHLEVGLNSGKDIGRYDSILVAVGRYPNSEAIFDESLRISLKNGAIEVGEDMQTSCEGIYAAGDVIGGPMLAHVASREGIVAVNRGLGFDKGDHVNFERVPEVVFSDPEIAQIGFVPDSTAGREKDIKVGRFPYIASSKALCEGESEGFVEVILDEVKNKIVGGGIVGAHASDLIGEIILAINGELSPQIIEKSIHPHPTLTEMIWEASADTIGKAISKIKKK